MALKRFFIHIITWNFSNNINCFRERKNTSVFEEELRINFRPISNIVGLFLKSKELEQSYVVIFIFPNTTVYNDFSRV